MPDKYFADLDKKTRSIEEKIDRQTENYLSKLRRQESKLKFSLWKKDSVLAKELFGDINERYNRLKNTSGNIHIYSSAYSGHLDSLRTTVQLLKNQNLANSLVTQKLLSDYNELQLKLNASDQIKKQIQLRQQQLTEKFRNLGMLKELKQFRKHVFYYQTQIKEYKSLFENPSKLEEKLLSLITKMPQFKDFFARNSILGSMFPLPGNGLENVTVIGLQSRSLINQGLTERFGPATNFSRQLQQNMQSAHGEFNALKSKISTYSSGHYGNGNADIPDFKVNNEKTKPFFKRLDFGANIQNQSARYFFPVTSDLGVSIGYRLNDNTVFGIGASYMLGWGSGWDNIRISHQGIGLRSYLDWKIKGSVYLAGGYEQNYKSLIQSVSQLRGYSAWQKSGLVGISKRYQLSKKLKGEMKLLWDFLSYQQVPKTQPIIFRIGYSLK